MSRAPPVDLYVGCFSDVHAWGGGLTSARGLAAAAAARGWCARLIGVQRRGEPATPPPHPPDVPQTDAAHFNVLLQRERGLWRLQSWRVVSQLERWLGALPAPACAFIGVSPHWVIAARRVWPRRPVFYKLPCLLSHCLPFTWPGRRPPGLWQRVDFAGLRRAEHRALECADLTLVPTELARREVAAFHPAAVRRLEVCPYGSAARTEAGPATSREAARRALGLDPGAFLVLAGGVCDLNKGFDWGIREVARVNGGPALRPVHLAIAGDGPERPRLAGLAAALGLSRRVHLPGPQADLAPWYAAADCVISTSSYDMFPNVIREAMQHGRPVVVPRHDPPHVYAGISELVEAQGGGCLYDRERPGALAACLDRLRRDAPGRAELGRRAQRAIAGRWTWSAVLDHILIRAR